MTALTNEERRLLAALATAAADVDPVPKDVVEVALSSLAWLNIDAELAELVEDSGLTAAGVRSAMGSRLLVFAAGAVEIDVEVAAAGDDALRLIGQVSPSGPGTVEVRQPGSEPVSAEVDEFGRFICEGVHRGQMSLTCTIVGTEHPVATSWVQV